MNRILALCNIALALGLTACGGSNPGNASDPGSALCASLTLDGLIKAAGIGPDNVGSDITKEHFPIVCPVADVSAMRTFSPNDLGADYRVTSEFEAAISRLGYRSATIAELLIWAKETWDDTGDPVALGSSWVMGNRLAPSIYIGGGQRWLELAWAYPDAVWSTHDRFLVVGSTGSVGTTGSNGGISGNSGTTGSGGTSGGSTKPAPTVNCEEFSSPGCSTYSSTTFGSICINAGCHFDLGDCVSHGDFSDSTCECTCS